MIDVVRLRSPLFFFLPLVTTTSRLESRHIAAYTHRRHTSYTYTQKKIKMLLLKIAAAFLAAGVAVYFAQVGRDELQILSAPVSSAPTTARATPASSPAADSRDDPVSLSLLDALTKSLVDGAQAQLLNVELVSDLEILPKYAGMHAVAKRDADTGETALIIPAALQFNDETADASLRKGLSAIAEKDAELGAKLRAKVNRDFLVTASLLLETRKGNRSKWWPWIATFPGAKRAMESLGYFASNEEFGCLPPRGQMLLSSWRQRAERFYELAKSLCETTVVPPIATGDEKEKKPPPLSAPQLVQKFMCQVEKPHVDWAVSMIISRGFNFVRFTTMFPVLDILPYRINATLRPGRINTEDSGLMVSIEVVTSGRVAKGDVLSFRTDLRDPIQAMLSQGMHDENAFLEGYEVFMDWSPLVLNVTSAQRTGPRPDGLAAYPTSELNCGTSHEANIVAVDGSYDEELLRCAELQVVATQQGPADPGDAAPLLAHSFSDPNIRRLAIELVMSAATRSTGDSFAECSEVLLGRSGLGREIGLHLVYAKGIMDRLRSKLTEALAA